MGYNSVADNRPTGLSSFVQLLLPPKHEKCREIKENLTLQQFISSKVIDLGVNGKPICDFLLVIVTLAVSATVFEILTLKDIKLLILPTHPLFDAPAGGTP